MPKDKLHDCYIWHIITLARMKLNQIVDIAERNDYGDPQQKVRQIKEYAEIQKNYFAQLTLDTPTTKNRTTNTDQSKR